MNPRRSGHSSSAFCAIAVRLSALAVLLPAMVVLFVRTDSGTLAVVGPILVAAGLWLVLQGLRDRADHLAVSRAVQLTPPKQGQWSAIAGKAVALGRDADAPENVLAYRYQIFDVASGKSRSGGMESKNLIPRYDGYFLAPTGIKSTFGTVQLFGFPDLIHTDERGLANDVLFRSKEKARLNPQYLPKFAARMLVSTRIGDRFDATIKYTDQESSSEGKSKFWQLRPDDEVCVFGVWKNAGLFPSVGRPRGLPVYAGTPEDVQKELGDTSKGFLVFGASVIVLTATWAVWMMFG